MTSCRYKADSKVHSDIQSELDKSDESMKGFECKDIKLREDMKHLKGKLKKLTDKIGKDAKKSEVSHLPFPTILRGPFEWFTRFADMLEYS